MSHAVRCPHCDNLSRVGVEAIGRTVACPHCTAPFEAAPDPDFAPPEPPRATRVRRPVRPRLVEEPDDVPVVGPARPDPLHSGHHDDAPGHGPSPALLGLAFLPLGIPLLWLVATLATDTRPIFSFAAPVALAVGLGGLTLGVGFAHGWSPATRLKGIIALALVGYFLAAFLFFLKKEWAEAARRRVHPDARWHDFTPPDKSYKVKVPWRGSKVDSPLPGWKLEGYRFVQDKKAAPGVFGAVYESAHGAPPADLAGPTPDDEWFAAVRSAVERSCDGRVEAERTVAVRQGVGGREVPGREFKVVLPDHATNRIVRVYRAGDCAFYLAVEGVAIPPDAPDVTRFLESLSLQLPKK